MYTHKHVSDTIYFLPNAHGGTVLWMQTTEQEEEKEKEQGKSPNVMVN